MSKKILILESHKTLPEIIISGSYWFRIEMAYGLKRLGFTPSLIQHPTYEQFPWINAEIFSNQNSKEEIEELLSNYDLVILLDDIPIIEKISTNETRIIYWDIEGFPYSNDFFSTQFKVLRENNFQYYGAKFNSIINVLKRHYFQFKKQELQYWDVDAKFSAAKNPLIKDSIHVPLGAEPELYKHKQLIKRDISLAIFGSTSRWFQAEQRFDVAEKILEKLNWPLSYWYGAMPEIEMDNMPKNCYPMGHVDFQSLPNFLLRSKKVLHVPRPYHLISNCPSVTIFQAAAAGAIPIHCFKGDLDIGYNYEEIVDLESLMYKKFQESFTYRARFLTMIEEIGGI